MKYEKEIYDGKGMPCKRKIWEERILQGSPQAKVIR